MIKILQIGLGPYSGGIENCIMNYYRYIDKSKFSFDFVDQYGEGLAYESEIKSLGGKIYTLKNYKRYPLNAALGLKKILKENDYHIVHINMLSAANTLFLDIAYADPKEKVVIAHSHNANVPPGVIRFMLHEFNKKRLQKAKFERWACGKKAGEWMWDKSFDVKDIIPNAIETQRFKFDSQNREKLRKQCGFAQDDIVIGYVGRFSVQKNIFFLLGILDSLRKKSSSYKLLLIGGGELESRLREETARLKLESAVFFAGIQEDTAPWYSAMDAFVLPSIFEGFPVVSIEAQSCGLSCFISDRVTKEVKVTKLVHFLGLTNNAEAWADEIERNLHQKEKCKLPPEYQIEKAVEMLEIKYKNLAHI